MDIEEPTEEEQKSILVQRICAFALLKALYSSLPGNTIRKTINTVYTQSFLRKNDSEVKVSGSSTLIKDNFN